MQRVTVRVPASTSNLGPGFDSLGVALGIYNDVTITRGPGGPINSMSREAAAAFFKKSRKRSFPFSLSVAGGVPVSRGLGSSVTLRLGVIHGLNALSKRPLNREQIYELCVRLEGHPDNAAPGEFGGCNVTAPGFRHRFTVSSDLYFVLLIPEFEIRTSAARRILPARIKRIDAVKSCQNACAITAAFASRDYESLQGRFGDFLHQPYRKGLVPFLEQAISAAEAAGALGGFLSGSGSTIAAVTLRSPQKVAAAMLNAAAKSKSGVVITKADNRGAHILPHS